MLLENISFLKKKKNYNSLLRIRYSVLLMKMLGVVSAILSK